MLFPAAPDLEDPLEMPIAAQFAQRDDRDHNADREHRRPDRGNDFRPVRR
jgi:hypothetical protein